MQLTDNLDVEDKLCNGSEGTVKYIYICTTISCAKDRGIIYIQFDIENSGNKGKLQSLGKLCSNTSEGKEIFIFITQEKKEYQSNIL